MSDGPVTAAGDGVRVAVRLTPKASRNAVAGLAGTADGRAVVKVSVTAVPEAGRANEALIKLLAKLWGVPRSAIGIAAGAADRNKVLHVAGDPAELTARLSGWLDGLAAEGTDRAGAGRGER
ncbi:MAG TPA: DUF167 family protein [Arenibaculum sp.]|nr:DUF167 family protein [Arenibaculum sp.]